VWSAGSLVSNVGGWMQRVAQDWLVLRDLTHGNATAVGIVTALQFAPQFFLLPWTGLAADRLDRRKLLLCTQGAMGALALGLGVLIVGGWVRLWHVYGFALALGCVTAFDSPARQSFVSEMVGEADLGSAVGLNAASFNLGRTIGPALAGLLIGGVGTGVVFLINAASFVAVLASLLTLRTADLHTTPRATGRGRAMLLEGVVYVWRQTELRVVLLMLLIIALFALNMPVFVSTMSVRVFHVEAGGYGVVSSVMAIGSVCGALMAARRERASVGLLAACAAVLGAGLGVAAVMPSFMLFGAVLVVVGVAAQTVTTSSVGLVQLTTAPAMRGRVMAIVLGLTLGAVAAGSPVVGLVADRFGPRWSLGVGAVAGLVAALVGWAHWARERSRAAVEARGLASSGQE
jgi:MFS family permease